MFSECEFHMNNSIVWKQLGSSLEGGKLDFNCANIYIRYRILASGFFQIKSESFPGIHAEAPLPGTESRFYSVLFNI